MHHVFCVEEEDKDAWDEEDDQVAPPKEGVLGEELKTVVNGKEEGNGRQEPFRDVGEGVGTVSLPAGFCAVQNPP